MEQISVIFVKFHKNRKNIGWHLIYFLTNKQNMDDIQFIINFIQKREREKKIYMDGISDKQRKYYG